jgi:effector-binding domain-containing protein
MKKTIEQIKQEANEKLAVQTYIEVKNWMNQTNIKGNKNVA